MERIYVMVRVRPLDSPEEEKSSPWRINDNSISIQNQSTKFEFDRIFEENCKTAEVYEARIREIVAASIHGFNGTVFAYGQTNSGKTHTMRGSKNEPGIIPLAVHGLFRIVQEHGDREFLLRMSYMEIYNEEINDLLVPEHRKLQIHESLERGIFVAGLREEIVASPEQVLNFMAFGESHRHIGETNMNLYSSRSHTIFRMIIESREKTEDGDVANSCGAVRVSVLNLVDLAGSERAAKTGAEGVRLKEGSHINKSLMTLGTVIKKLSEGVESQGGHVPYRDSKLTRILQPALGGNANTAIICNITLAQVHTDETKSSLQFASRALCVTNCAHVNEILTDAALLKRQKKEIQELREKLLGSHSEHSEEEILNLRNTLLQSELERERITLELQEEKKAQAQRDKRLQEQAKKIADLSSMVLHSNMDDKKIYHKRNKRRETWCPGALSGKSPIKELSAKSWIAAIGEPFEEKHESDLPPFEELAVETEESMVILPNDGQSPENLEDCGLWDGCNLPDARALSRVTNRRKLPFEKMTPILESDDLVVMQTKYEDFLLEFDAQRTRKDIEIDNLRKRLEEAESFSNRKRVNISDFQPSESSFRSGKNLTVRESEAIIVIKQLQEQIEVLETEKSSIQSNLDSLVDLATKQNVAAQEKYEEARHEMEYYREQCEVIKKLLNLSEERVEQEKKCSMERSMEIDQMMNDITVLEAQSVQCQKVLESRIGILSSEHHFALEEVEKLQNQLNVVNEERDKLLLRIKEMDIGLDHSAECKDKLLATNEKMKKVMAEMEHKNATGWELEILKQNYDEMLSKAKIDVEGLTERVSSLEAKISEDDGKMNKETTKLRMRLRMTQLKLDAMRGRYRETVDEMDLMDRKFKEASSALKQQLVTSRLENLELTKQLSAARSCSIEINAKK